MKKLLLVCLVMLSFSCQEENEFIDNKTVQYSVGGTSGDYNVTYAGYNNTTKQVTNVANDWKIELTVHQGDSLFVFAQNQKTSGSVEVYIYIDGEMKKSASSSGAYAVASVSMKCP